MSIPHQILLSPFVSIDRARFPAPSLSETDSIHSFQCYRSQTSCPARQAGALEFVESVVGQVIGRTVAASDGGEVVERVVGVVHGGAGSGLELDVAVRVVQHRAGLVAFGGDVGSKKEISHSYEQLISIGRWKYEISYHRVPEEGQSKDGNGSQVISLSDSNLLNVSFSQSSPVS